MNSDNGIPPLSDARSFSVVVSSPPQFTGATAGTNGQVEIQFTTLPGQNYQVQYKTNLDGCRLDPARRDHDRHGLNFDRF